MSTHDGFYRQIDGLAMGSPPAPHLANGWMSSFDPVIQDQSPIYTRYMDDILCAMNKHEVNDKLKSINELHPSLTFTCEREDNQCIAFLDMNIINKDGILSSEWYRKPSDTGLIMNYHSLAPKKYKRSVVSGFVYRIYNSCSSWKLFNDSLEKAKVILLNNQYPPVFFEPIINDTLTKIISKNIKPELDNSIDSIDNAVSPSINPNAWIHSIADKDKFLFFIQYRGKTTDNFASELHKLNAPCRVVMTLRKLQTVLPSRKPGIDKMMRSNVVYKLTCPRCLSCYVGQTIRQMRRRFSDHVSKSGVTRPHMEQCGVSLKEDNVTILASTSRGDKYLMTLEALFIQEIKPKLNTKDEFKSRILTLKF